MIKLVKTYAESYHAKHLEMHDPKGLLICPVDSIPLSWYVNYNNFWWMHFVKNATTKATLYNPETNVMNNTPLQAAPDESTPQLFQRLVNPPCTLRATGWNRFEGLPHQPQLNYETPFDFFIPARSIDKERYKSHDAKDK